MVIGKDGSMPWMGLLPSDMARFKNLTSQPDQNSLIMGRKTWDSIPEKFRPFDKNLPPEEARQTIILTRNLDFHVDDPRVLVAHTLTEAVWVARSKTVWIAGGEQVYELAMNFANFIHQTLIHREFEGDAFFPGYNYSNWETQSSQYFCAGQGDSAKDKVDSSYTIFRRKQ